MSESHYDVLGVQADATVDSIRDSYRRLARVHHPDTPGGSDEAMSRLNEAWRVLVDPARRAMYDATLRGGTRRAAPVATDRLQREVYPVAPRTREDRLLPFPIRWVVLAALLGIVVLVVLGQVARTAPISPVVDNLIEPGSCVSFDPNGDADEVDCAGPHDAVAADFVPFDQSCPQTMRTHRDRQGRGWVCVVPS